MHAYIELMCILYKMNYEFMFFPFIVKTEWKDILRLNQISFLLNIRALKQTNN